MKFDFEILYIEISDLIEGHNEAITLPIFLNSKVDN